MDKPSKVEMNSSGEFFSDLIDHVAQSLVDEGISQQKANDKATNIAIELSKVFAGEKFYVAKSPVVNARHLSMYKDLKHMNYKDVDKKYAVSAGYSLKVAKNIRDARKHREELRKQVCDD